MHIVSKIRAQNTKTNRDNVTVGLLKWVSDLQQKNLPILERNIIVHCAAWRYLIVGMVASVVGIAACIGCLIRWIVR